MKLKHHGTYAVYVPALRRAIAPGDPVDVEDAALARQLRRQGWRQVKTSNDDKGRGND